MYESKAMRHGLYSRLIAWRSKFRLGDQLGIKVDAARLARADAAPTGSWVMGNEVGGRDARHMDANLPMETRPHDSGWGPRNW